MIPSYQDHKNGKKFETDKEKLMSLPEYDLDTVEDKGKKTYPEGEYFFTVRDAQEKTAATSGKVYTNLILDVETSDGMCAVYDSMFYSSAALFRIKQFMDATGIEKPTESMHYIGAMGKAKFVKKDGYLSVRWYISKDEAGESPEKKFEVNSNTQKEIDEIPF